MKPVDPNLPLGQRALTTPAHRQFLAHRGTDSRPGRDPTSAGVCRAHRWEPRTDAGTRDALPKSRASEPAAAVNAKTLSELCDHLEKPQLSRLRQQLKKLDRMTRTAAVSKGEANPQLLVIREAFVAFRTQLIRHLRLEEREIFPMIRHVATGDHRGRPTGAALEFELIRMEEEHHEFGEALAELGALMANKSLQLQFPIVTRRMTSAVAEFRHLVQDQIFHENEVLFPRALAYRNSA
jgi:regulator of cell morphogenesis and NO signaling